MYGLGSCVLFSIFLGKYICSIELDSKIVNLRNGAMMRLLETRKLANRISEMEFDLAGLKESKTFNGNFGSIGNETSAKFLTPDGILFNNKLMLDYLGLNKNSAYQLLKQTLDSDAFGPQKAVHSRRRERSSVETFGGAHKRAPGSVVAFHVHLSFTRCVNPSEILKFDVEELDLGNGYTPSDGIYDVPMTGVYVFTWTVTVHDQNFAFTTELIANGARIGIVKADSDGVTGTGVHPATAVVVTRLDAGSHVFVRMVDVRFTCGVVQSNEEVRTTFSGWLLY